MEAAIIKAALSVVGTALAPFRDALLENWAATKDLGLKVKELELELLAVQALLEHTAGKEIADNSALKELLVRMQELGYDAEDMLDELDYFRIQDELDGTFEAADEHAKGCTCNLALNIRHTTKAVARPIISLAACFCATALGRKTRLTSASCCSPVRDVGKHFPCSSHHVQDEPQKLIFNRVDASERMKYIVEQLRLVGGIVSRTVTTLGSKNLITVPDIAQSRPITTPDSTEPKLYGRDAIMNTIIHDITKGKHSHKVLTVVPIVGLGGMGKTTLAQHIYHSGEVQEHFNVKVWTCVSLNFNVNRLLEEIKKWIPKVDGETETDTAGELIGKRLKNKRFLLVLDDIWDCSNEDEWKRLLLPFNKSQVHGNIIMVTTRFSKQAQMMIQNHDMSIDLKGLDNEEYKMLFLDIVFGHGQSRIIVDKSLLDIGDKIVAKLKGSPLAAKTVGRLLKKQLHRSHWNRVLDSKEWDRSNDKHDIMPALKLSYYYLPSQLQRCFSYCALFPQDHKFKREELINFWIGLDVLHSSHDKTESLEDIGVRHLTELVDHGFFENEREKDGSACYIVHDLLHELARKVSSHECLTIDISQSQVMSSLQIPPSIRHLSINVDDTSVKDRLTFNNCVANLNTLDKRLKIKKLRSLLLFGEHHSCFLKAFGDLFKEAKALRVVFLSEASYGLEDLLLNFYNLVHLRYLRIESSWLIDKICRNKLLLPNKLSRFYHMLIIDAKDCQIFDLPRNMSNLVKLRHFVIKDDAAHSRIAEVGKLKSLQELRRFVVKQEGQGFELRQIGHLAELRGTLFISNLENVHVKEEADEAKLMHKHHLQGLTLHWNIGRMTGDSALEEHVLERLEPSSYLQKLCIIGHRGATCPSWLGMNLLVQNLESLCLESVSWKTFPPLGWLLDQDIPIKTPDIRFENLKRLELVNLPLKTWDVPAPCQLLPLLEVLIIRDCFELEEMSFSHSACCPQEKEPLLFRQLTELKIIDCPRLSRFPAVPWTEAPCSIEIRGTNIRTLDSVVCQKYSDHCSLRIEGKDTSDGTFWDVLDFRNLTKLTNLSIDSCPPLPLHDLQVLHQFPVELLSINRWDASGKELTQLLTYFPKLTYLRLYRCKNITGLGVMGQEATTTPEASSSAHKVDKAQIEQDAGAEEEIVTLVPEQGLLLLPPQLQLMHSSLCPELHIQGGRGGLQGLSSLRHLLIENCPKLLCSWSSSFSCFPFPNSLEQLSLLGAVGKETRVPLSNLSSLTSLSIFSCGDLRGDGLLSLLAQGHLTNLYVSGTPRFFDDFEIPWSQSKVFEQELASSSFKLQLLLSMDDVARVTAMPMRSLLSSLTKLEISMDKKVESFTVEHEALQFLYSLEVIGIYSCSRLKHLPAWLHILPRLRKLMIRNCHAIQIRTEDRLPSSLQKLIIDDCPKIKSLSKDWLPNSLQRLVIDSCPAILSLPKADDLPSSLRKLNVRGRGSEELKKHCRKLIGIIPIVKADLTQGSF